MAGGLDDLSLVPIFVPFCIWELLCSSLASGKNKQFRYGVYTFILHVTQAPRRPILSCRTRNMPLGHNSNLLQERKKMADELTESTKGQLELDLTIVTEVEADGVGMGVLSNGAPYLTGRGLARLCGVDHSTIIKITNEWQHTPPRKRVTTIKQTIRDMGGDDTYVFLPVQRGGTINHAFPENVCMAILEYYALDSNSANEHAKKAYRTLARKGFVDFVYEQVGLSRGASIRDFSTKQFMDRVSSVYGSVPVGYFCVFEEISDMFAALIAKDVKIDSSFVPDISVGKAWSKYWEEENLDAVYGMRQKFSHQYPSYYPQSAVGPQEAYCYPEDARGEFSRWKREVYQKKNLRPYLERKVKTGSLASTQATAIVDAYKPAKSLQGK